MNVVRENVEFGVSARQRRGGVPGVGARVPQPGQAWDVARNGSKQLWKLRLVRVVAIVSGRECGITKAVDSLAEEEHLPRAGRNEALYLLDDLASGAIALRSARVRYDAEAASFVAALHRRHQGYDGSLPRLGPCGEKARGHHVEFGAGDGGGAGHLFHQQGRQLRDVVGTEDEVDVSNAFEELLTLLLRHAAGDGDDEAGPRFLERSKLADLAAELLLCLSPRTTARVEDDEIRLFDTLDREAPRGT